MDAWTRRDAWISLAVGLLIAASGILTLLAHPDREQLLTQTGIHFAFGREAGIPGGLATGLDWRVSAVAATWLEWGMLFTLAPVLMIFGERLHRIPRIRRFLDAAEVHARAHPNAGVLMLGLLTLMPGLPMGALTSVFIGEALRLPSWRLLPAVALAELAANATTALAASVLAGFFPDPRLAAAVMAVLFVGLGLYAWFAPGKTPTPPPAVVEEA